MSNAQIVVSSSWRELYTLDRMISEMFNILKTNDFHKYWMTPLLRANTRNHDKLIPRGAEISTWLYNHTNITNYVILDDLPPSDFTDHLSNLVSCSSDRGITNVEIMAAMRILNNC